MQMSLPSHVVHRGRKAHPDVMSVALTGAPGMERSRSFRNASPRRGRLASSAAVYGCRGSRTTLRRDGESFQVLEVAAEGPSTVL